MLLIYFFNLDARHKLCDELHLPRAEDEAGGGQDRRVRALRLPRLLGLAALPGRGARRDLRDRGARRDTSRLCRGISRGKLGVSAGFIVFYVFFSPVS